MEIQDIWIVVGDRFYNYNNISSCILYSDWKDLVKSGETHAGTCLFVPGQGLSPIQIDNIYRQSPFFESSPPPIATQKQTHKHISDNILITEPIKTGENTYSSKLVLQENNEFILDHTTGYHIPGMIFLEVTRQMSTSVVDLLFNDSNSYYVMHNIYAEYLNFSFPIETFIELTIEHKETENREKYFNVTVDFYQNSTKVVTSGGRFTASKKSELCKKEARIAQITTNKFCRLMKKKLKEEQNNEEILREEIA